MSHVFGAGIGVAVAAAAYFSPILHDAFVLDQFIVLLVTAFCYFTALDFLLR